MLTSRIKRLYNKACKELSLINQTLLKTNNESISFLICQDIKECMSHFLQCYILMKKGKLSRSKSIGDLFYECAELDNRLKKFDVRWIDCKDFNLNTKSDVFCISTQRIQVCAIITNGFKKLVDQEMEKMNYPVNQSWDEILLFQAARTKA